MSTPIYTAVVGDTSDIWELGFLLSAPGEDDVFADLSDPDWSCWIGVPGAGINREVVSKTADNQRFRAWLTPAETAAIGVRTAQVGIELRNPALDPPLVKEYQLQLVLTAGLVT